MAYAYSRISSSEHLIVGTRAIAAYVGVHTSTIQSWTRWHGFPVARLPNGQTFTTPTLIDKWVLARAQAAQEQREQRGDASATNPMAYSRSRRDGAPTSSEGHSPQPPKPSKARRNGASKALW